MLLLTLVSLAAAAPAHAGQYSVAYSGGADTIQGGNINNMPGGAYIVSPRYEPQGSYGAYAIGAAVPPSQPNPSPVTVTCSGTITATFTWQPDYPGEPAPGSAIVEQQCSVGSGSNGDDSGAINDGLGDSSSVTETDGTMTLSRTVYAVKSSPGTSFSQTCNPSASGYGVWASVNAAVDYTAAAFPVTINLTGGIGPSTAKSLLVGQQLGATLSTGPLTQTSWSWGASGGEPFKNWTASASNATYTPLGSETGSQIMCNFAQPTTSASVSCSAHVAVPSGASPASGLDVTGSQVFTVEKPSAQLDISIGTVTDLPTSTNPNAVALQQVYTYPPTGAAKGITWAGKIATPAQYVSSGSYGSWNWTQLVTNQRQQKNNGVYWQFAVNTTTPATIINGWSVLDGTYPYANFWYTADGSQAGNGDSPAQGLDQNIAIREYDVSDSFNDYLMYQPPGSGSLPVPLKLTNWYWDFQALKDASNNWSTSGKNAQWGFVSDFPAFPTWTFCATIGQLVYVAPSAQQ